MNLEQGKSCRPSTLIKISTALGLHVERFFDQATSTNEPAVAHRHEDDRWFSLLGFGSGPVKGIDRPLTDGERDALRESGQGPLMLMFRNIPSDAGFIAGIIELNSASEPRRHPGKEFVFVLRGRASIRVGVVTQTLVEGESLYFDGDEEHSYAPDSGSGQSVSLLTFRVD